RYIPAAISAEHAPVGVESGAREAKRDEYLVAAIVLERASAALLDNSGEREIPAVAVGVFAARRVHQHVPAQIRSEQRLWGGDVGHMLGNSFFADDHERIVGFVVVQAGPVRQQLLDRYILEAWIESMPVVAKEVGQGLAHRRRERKLAVANEGRHAGGGD